MSKRVSSRLYLGLSMFGIIFFFFMGQQGAIMGGDSELYINFGHYSGVMPVYPLFLQVCKTLFGNQIWLEVAAIIQGILALICCLALVIFLQKIFATGIFGTIALFLFSLMPYAIELPRYVISHELMTEGIAYPVFYLFILIIAQGVFHKRQGYVFIAFGVSLFLSLVRPQMQFLYAVTAVVLIYIGIWNIKEKGFSKVGKSAGWILAAAILIFGGIRLTYVIDGWYENAFFGGHGQDSSNYTIQCRVIYASDAEDANFFEDPVLKEIYEKTYAEMEREKCTWKYMRNDLWRWKDIVGGSGQVSRIVQRNVEDYLRQEVGMKEDIQVEQTKNRICGEMADILLRHNWPEYLLTSLMLMPSGFVASVLFQREGFYVLCHIGTVILYLAAVLAIILFYRKKYLDTRKAELMLLIIGTAAVNVIASNLILFGLQRYMVYTYGLFYMGMFLIVAELWKKRAEVFKRT